MPESPPIRPEPESEVKRRFRGCFLGGAVGDALGAPVEFMSLAEIRATFGDAGITEFTTAFERQGAITDDTQMALFTAEGLLRSHVRHELDGTVAIRRVVGNAYLRWLRTQGKTSGVLEVADGWLIGHRPLFASRVPASACLEALTVMAQPGQRAGNQSKGCGAAARSAPIGMFCARESGASTDRVAKRALEIGIDLAALTHGHPTAQVTAGAFAAIIASLVREVSLVDAIARIKPLLVKRPMHGETLHAIERAQSAAIASPASAEAVVGLGEGWVADEALAIALYCSLTAPDFETGVRLAVNHNGDSDSTGTMAGNLLGAIHGVDGIPRRWMQALELRDVIAQTADDLATYPQWPVGQFHPTGEANSYWMERYPGW